MAQTGFTPIQLYYSSTTTNAPSAGNLASGELAINITDGKLFYKDNANAVQVIGWKTVPATAGGTGQTSYAVGDLLYANTTTTLAKLADVATGNALISGGIGVAPSWGKIGLTTHISGTLGTGNGGTGQSSNLTQYGIVYGSTTTAMATSLAGTSTQVLHGNASGAPTWSAVSLTADVSGILPIANGGTNSSIIATFSATQNVAQALSASTLTLINFQNEEFDTNSYFNNTNATVGNALAYSFNPQTAGYYQLNACVSAESAFTGGQINFYKNGTIFKRGINLTTAVGGAFPAAAIIYFNGTTDCVQVYAAFVVPQNVSAAVSDTWFQASFLRSA